jgi:hypothetical protein
MNAEITTQTLESFKQGEYFKSSVRLMPSLRPVPGLELFGGPVFNYVNTNTTEGRAITDKYIRTWENRWGNNFEGSTSALMPELTSYSNLNIINTIHKHLNNRIITIKK